MINIFNPYQKFTITEANFNTYSKPFIHPKRKMAEYDFIYLISGKWKIGQDDEEFDIQQDSILILAGNHTHYGISPCQKNTKTMYFHVSIENSFYIENKKIELESLINVSFNTKIKSIFNNIVIEKSNNKSEKAEEYFRLLLLELSDNSSLSETNSIILNMENIIKNHPENFFSNEELAKKVHVSVKTAEKIFKQEKGITIHQYILNYKINKAISFFKNYPTMSIKEIALNLGFYDEYHFSKQFKKKVGVSPKNYKKNNV